MRIKFFTSRAAALGASAIFASMVFSTAANAAPLAILDSPLFLNGSVAPLNMLVMGRDHKLYYEAYNDHSDLDGDDKVDSTYKPLQITYFGYFDSKKCYTYTTDSRFVPTSMAAADKSCSGTAEWSGDWLNYVTTSRMDALRKVLFGGLRSTDTESLTVLERANVPQDAHSWGKSYESEAHDGYDLTKYTPLSLPAANSAHLFANTTLVGDADRKPLLRILTDKQTGKAGDTDRKPLKIWNWVSIERMVADSKVVTGRNTNGSEIRSDTGTIVDKVVRVVACDASKGTTYLETNCRAYKDSKGNTNYKPGGLLQEFGEQDLMKFGLITGTYAKNTDGGVVRKNMGSIKSEIYSDGTFKDKDGTWRSTNGIIRTLSLLRTTNFNGTYGCGWIVSGAISSGQCQMWGNPIGEMMYEALRYFRGGLDANPDFSITAGQGEESDLGNLPVVAKWTDPYTSNPRCAKPFETVISDINPSYDSDKLPGSVFNTYGDDLGGLNVATIGKQIWDKEMSKAPTDQKYYIGESKSDTNVDYGPTAKSVTSFGNIRGLAPEEPTKEGSYYSASVAHWGNTHDISTTAAEDQKVATFAVALASPLPRIEIPVDGTKNGRHITIVPFAKTVGGSVNGQNVSAEFGKFQPTDQIVDFYVDTLTDTYGKFRVNYEDVEQGADHDMDAIAIYEYTLNADKSVDITVTSEYAAGSLIQHMGYVISGTKDADGTYFVIRDTDTTSGDPDYYLDTPPGQPPAKPSDNSTWKDGKMLPLTNSRHFTPGNTTAAQVLKDPLWYAAKWGGFIDTNKDGIPNDADPDTKTPSEWDQDGDGSPDNYFLVTNALTLGAQLTKAFNEIRARVNSAASASVNSGSISSESRVYQAKFNSGDWSGELLAYKVITEKPKEGETAKGPIGSIGDLDWNAAKQMPTADKRQIITVDDKRAAVPFQWDKIGDVRKGQLQPLDGDGEARLNYLRGSDAAGNRFRKRASPLGDIVNSSPLFIGKPPFRYQDATYVAFRDKWKDRKEVVYVGANDGMLHAFDGATGVELFAYIPSMVFPNLVELTKTSYAHRYFVDGTPSMGDVQFKSDSSWHTMLIGGLNKGGQGVYALDVTDPSTFTEGKASSIVRWEFTDTDDADLGYTYSKPAIVKVRSATGSKWVAAFGNGYNSTQTDGHVSASGKGVLFFVDIETGKLLTKIEVPAQASSNGLATPAMVDFNGDGVVDYAFAGDLFGNMWKFNLTDNDPKNWAVAFKSQALFTAKDKDGKAQPITSRPEVGRGPNDQGMIVLFGTGKFLESGDNIVANLSTQTFYGLIDKNTAAMEPIAGRGSLTPQTIIYEGIPNLGAADTAIRATSNTTVTNSGWYLDLLSGPPGVPTGTGFKGEMSVSDSVLRNGRIIFSTIIPNSDPCTIGGDSWLMELDALSGGRLPYTPFDLTDDEVFDSQDYITIKDEKGNDIKVPAGGRKSKVGMSGKPGILGGDKAEFNYSSGTSGNVESVRANPGPGDTGRQSWRQMR